MIFQTFSWDIPFQSHLPSSFWSTVRPWRSKKAEAKAEAKAGLLTGRAREGAMKLGVGRRDLGDFSRPEKSR